MSDEVEPVHADVTQPATQPATHERRRRWRLPHGLWTLRPRELFVAAQLAGLLLAILVLQHLLSVPRLMRLIDVPGAAVRPPSVSIRRLVWLTRGLLRLTLRDAFCMKQALLLFHFLRRWGYPARVCFGVMKVADGIKGHAWVELAGRPLAERREPRSVYSITYSYPSEPRPTGGRPPGERVDLQAAGRR